MKPFSGCVALAMFFFLNPGMADENCPATLDFSKKYLASETTVRLCDEFAGKVLLVVNTASYCGFTPQFEGLEALYEKYRVRGFSVLGFPSNDFFQEPRGEKRCRSSVASPTTFNSRCSRKAGSPNGGQNLFTASSPRKLASTRDGTSISICCLEKAGS